MYLGDLHVYEIAAMTWTDLSGPESGIPPTAREEHGFTAAGGLLYVLGGYNTHGTRLS